MIVLQLRDACRFRNRVHRELGRGRPTCALRRVCLDSVQRQAPPRSAYCQSPGNSYLVVLVPPRGAPYRVLEWWRGWCVDDSRIRRRGDLRSGVRRRRREWLWSSPRRSRASQPYVNNTQPSRWSGSSIGARLEGDGHHGWSDLVHACRWMGSQPFVAACSGGPMCVLDEPVLNFIGHRTERTS
jgi:hypothetical protein